MERITERQRNFKKKRRNLRIKSIGIIIVLISLIILLGLLPHAQRHTYNVTVTDKQIKRYDEDDKYLIFTKDDNGKVDVFENTDSLFELKFNSSDLYGELIPGNKYIMKTYGFRIPFCSSYENIINVSQTK